MKLPSESTVPCKTMLMDLLYSNEHVEAGLLYGSVARGDAESYSDIDVLALCPVGQKRSVYDDLGAALSSRFSRVSLSIYSKREMRFLANAKSLFLLHLSTESVSLLDRTGWLTTLVKEFEPKESYDDDFKMSLDLLTPLGTRVANAPNQLHRLAYAYSLFRVFGVYLLAARRVFEFSKAKMARCLIQSYPDESQDIEFLSDLRVLNANFFSGGNPSSQLRKSDDLPTLEKSVASLANLVNVAIKVEERPYRDAVNEFLNAAISHRSRLGYRLRTWFLLLIYDGINLFLRKEDYPALTSFSESPLIALTSSDFAPEAIRRAAHLGAEYLRNYPLKYFLLEDSKIPTDEACSSLVELASVIHA
jgi:predicted nucleotidyltransferase